ncbi:hypothetical protein AB5I41_18715 [Sphingomonas sp. MMS24-JH45]
MASLAAAVEATPTRRPGFVLAALTFVYVLNFLDRQLIGIVAKPIQVARRQRRAIGADRRALFRDVLLLHRDPRRVAGGPHQPRRRALARLRGVERGDGRLRGWRPTTPSSSSRG